MLAAAEENVDLLLNFGVHGAKLISVGRFNSTRFQALPTTAVAIPFVVVWSCIDVLHAELTPSKDCT